MIMIILLNNRIVVDFEKNVFLRINQNEIVIKLDYIYFFSLYKVQ